MRFVCETMTCAGQSLAIRDASWHTVRHSAREPAMQQSALNMNDTLRLLRMVHAALVVSMILYAWIPGQTLHSYPNEINRQLFTTLAILAGATLGAAVIVRAKMIQPAVEALRSKPDDRASLNRWRAGSFIVYALTESVVLYGFVLLLQGATRSEAAGFYVAGIGLMLWWYPRRP